MKKFFVNAICLCIGLTSLLANLGAQEEICLSGTLVKKYYPAPRIVRNPAFGWYLELNKSSQESIKKQYRQLSEEDQRTFNDLNANLQMVQCIDWSDDNLLQARRLDGELVLIKGRLGAPCLSRKYLCFSIASETIASDTLIKNVAINSSFDTFDYLYDRFYMESAVSDDNKTESLLQLSENASEKPVALRGKLKLRLFPGPPEYTSIEKGDRADYCWMLHLDEESLKVATATPVPEPALDLKSIMEQSNHRELYLSLGDNMTDFCCEHESKDITVQGYMFHAHTAHHYSPIVMNVHMMSEDKKIKKD